MGADDENLALTIFQDIVCFSPIKGVKINRVDGPFLGRFNAIKKSVEISKLCAEIGFEHKHEEAVILHEFGHANRGILDTITGPFAEIITFSGLAFLLLAILGLFLTFLNTSLAPLYFLFLFIWGILLLSLGGSIFLYNEMKADDFARQILSKKYGLDIVRESYTLSAKYKPDGLIKGVIFNKKLTPAKKLSYLKYKIIMPISDIFISRDERIARLANRDWFWIPMTYKKHF